MDAFGIFLVTDPKPKGIYQHVLVTAEGREMAKNMAFGAFKGDKEKYVVTPVTQPGERTMVILATEVTRM